MIMQEILIYKLHQYIRENNPDLLLQLESEGKVTEYLQSKISSIHALLNQLDKEQPAYIIEDSCINLLTQELRPSKFNYICIILEEEFAISYQQLKESHLLKFEAINMITYCQQVFDIVGFTEANEDNRLLRYAIAGAIGEYLDHLTSENDNVSHGLQQPTKIKG